MTIKVRASSCSIPLTPGFLIANRCSYPLTESGLTSLLTLLSLTIPSNLALISTYHYLINDLLSKSRDTYTLTMKANSITHISISRSKK